MSLGANEVSIRGKAGKTLKKIYTLLRKITKLRTDASQGLQASRIARFVSPSRGERCINMFKRLALIVFVLYGGCAFAQTRQEIVKDSVKIYFRQGKTDLVPSLKSNQKALSRIEDSLKANYADSVYKLKKVLVIGGASPEGSVRLNKLLSEERANTLFNHLSHYGELPDSLKSTLFLGRDWNGLLELTEADPDVPHKEATIHLLRNIIRETQTDSDTDGGHCRQLKELCDGKPYNYLYNNLFPELRASRLYLTYEKVRYIEPQPPAPQPVSEPVPETVIPEPETVKDTVPIPESKKPFYMDFRTNLLYDALLVPGIGAEFYLGKRWSIVADWMYGWWSKDRIHWYWRTYGGGLTIRKWLGKASKDKPLTGHHIGINGQLFTYDFETGGKGYLGGKPGGNLWEKINWSAGFEYGYALPVARKLNLDFSMVLGYSEGLYHEYIPVDDCYVWQATRQRRWIGPTKAEISLVWLIGHGNCNIKKGGRR